MKAIILLSLSSLLFTQSLEHANISLLGAARQVSGSSYYIDTNTDDVLIDCGIFYPEDKSIDYDLDVATSNYINDASQNTIGTATCQLSKIFEWYFTDFIGPMNMVGFINKYSAVKINDNTKLEFKEYDWNLYK